MGGLAGALFFPTSSTHIGNQSPHIGSLASLIPMSYGSEAKSPKGSVNGTAASSFGKDLLGQGFDRRTCFQALNHLKLYRMAFTQIIAEYCRSLWSEFQKVALWIELGLHWNLQWMSSRDTPACTVHSQTFEYVHRWLKSAEYQFELQPDVLNGGDPWKPSSLVGAKCSSACITSIFIDSWTNYDFSCWNNLRN